MGERTSYAPGTFSWVDLSTADPAGAKTFYSELFGWSFEDMPAGEAGTYTMCRLDGKDVAALFGQGEQERSQGIPPHWNSYVTVDDLETRAAKVGELGGNPMMSPFDVMEAGRMAVVGDPTGAVFAMWEPKNHIGASLVNVPGALTWNELATNDVAAAKKFYEALLGWTTEDLEGPVPYSMIKNGDRMTGGIRPLGEQESGVPPSWLPYFATASCDETLTKIRKAGGQVLVGPMDLPAGRIAGGADPQGAAFALFEGELDD